MFKPKQRPSDALTERDSDVESVPRGMRIAGAWSWRVLALTAVIAVVIWLVVQLRLLVIPVLVATILAALLMPLKNFLVGHRWPRWAAVTAAVFTAGTVVVLLSYLIITQVVDGFPDLRDKSVKAFEDLISLLEASPLAISPSDIESLIGSGITALQENSQALLSGVASFGTSLGHLLTGSLLVVFAFIFLLYDGEKIWGWLVQLFPVRARAAVSAAGVSGWTTLQSYVKVQILVATIDAVGIGLGAAIFGVPFALPIAVLVFVGSFIPILGALVSGAVAVFIALVYNGWAVALAMLGVVLLVQQIESNVLQPLLMGSAVRVHPLGVVLAVTGGSMVAGIAGAFFAVPVVATLNAMITTIASGARRNSPLPRSSTPPRKPARRRATA